MIAKRWLTSFLTAGAVRWTVLSSSRKLKLSMEQDSSMEVDDCTDVEDSSELYSITAASCKTAGS